MQLTDKDGNVFGTGGLEITTSSGKPKIPVINTDITIGTTAIVGGVAGRLLFDDAGVVGETNGVHWDKVNSRLGLGTATPTQTLDIQGDISMGVSGATTVRAYYNSTTRNQLIYTNTSSLEFFQSINERMRLAPGSGNLLLNTTTDAGFKLDVNGTQRVQVSSAGIPNILSISNLQTDAGPGGAIAFYTGGVVGNASRIVAQRSGSVGQSDIALETNGVRRLFVSANDGNVGIGTTTLGTTTQLTIGGAQTASSAIARGILLNTSLTQSIANDVLTAVQITPTLSVNNTLFHEAYWLRLTGSYTPASYTSNNNATTIDLSNSFTNTFNAIGIRIRHTYGNVQNGYGILLESAGFIGIAQTSSTSNNFFAGTTIIGNSVTAPASGYTLHVTNNTNGAIKIGSVNQGSEHLIISHSQAGATFSSIRNTYVNTGAQMQISVGGQDNLRLFGTGNVVVGGTTDAGYKLDVAGTTRIQNTLTVSSPGFTSLYTSNTFAVDTGSNNYRTANLLGWFGYHAGSGTNNTLDAFAVGGNSSSSSNASYFFRVNLAGGNSSGPYGASGNNVALAQLNAPTTSRLYLTAQGGGGLVEGSTNGFLISTVTDGHNLSLRSEKGAGGSGGGINYLSSINGSNHSHRFFHNNVEQMRLQYSGNLLIGTTTDSGYKLDVNGTSRFTQALTVNAGGIKTESGTITGQTGVNSGRMTMFSLNNTGGGYLAALNSSLAIGFQNRDVGGLWSADFIELKVYDNSTTTATTGYNFYTHNQQTQSSASVLAMSIRGQSVGIGTENPSALLEVNGSARVQSGLTVSGSLNLNSSDISSAWTAYTPTWSTDGATQPSLGNGTITGAYKVIGKTVFVRVRLVFGTTTTAGTGAFYFSLPVNAAAAWGVQMPASILDNGNAWYQATVNGEYGGFTDKVALITQSAGGANSSQGVTGVFPIGFGNTDSLQFNGSYESV